MTTGLDAVDWAEVSHAYGPATDTADHIRALASDDPEAVGEALGELAGSIHHQGTVYPATVVAVPFLVEAVARARHERAHLVTWIGMLADPHHSYGRAFPSVRAAVREHAGPLAALVRDDDGEVRAAAVYLGVQAGSIADPAELWDDPALRVAVLFALAAGGPAGGGEIFQAAFDDEPEVRLAAALAMQRAGLPWPDGAIDALAEVFEAEADLPYEWHARHEPTTELIVKAPDEVRDALIQRVLPIGEPILWILGELFRSSRGARARYVPMLGPLLADPLTRKATVDLLHKAGRAAGQYRDELAAVAGGYAAVADSQGFTEQLYAVQALMRLGDPRWVGAACEGARAGGRHHLLRGAIAYNPETLAAVGARLDALPVTVVTDADRAEFATLRHEIRDWGPSSAPLIPRLRELVRAYGTDAVMLLAGLGDDSAVVVQCLREAAPDDVAAAVALWRLTGETEAVVAGVRRLTSILLREERRRDAADQLRTAIPAAAHLVELAGELRAVTGDERLHVQERLPAAHLLWAVTGETAAAISVVRACLESSFWASEALDLARLMNARDLTGRVRELLGEDGRTGVAAARTLWAFGTPPVDLLPGLRRCLENGFPLPASEALDLIVEIGHPEAVPMLRELAERDQAVVTAGAEPDIVWDDEDLRDRLRIAVTLLTPPAG